MPRSVVEWRGASPDTPVPIRVRLRVYAAFDGRCGCCGRKIMAGEVWQTDHIKPLIAGGENRESNLQPILVEHHKPKTAGEVAEKSKVARVRAKHLGAKRPRRTIPGRKFDGTPTPARWVQRQ